MNSNKLGETFSLIETFYKGQFKRPTGGELAIWEKTLEDFSLKEIVEGFKKYRLQETRYCPTLARLEGLCREERERKAEYERQAIKAVSYKAGFAVDNYPLEVGFKEGVEAKKRFIEKCLKAKEPIKAAEALAKHLREAGEANNVTDITEVIEGFTYEE